MNEQDFNDFYARAWKFWPTELLKRVRNLNPSAHWIPTCPVQGERFWFCYQSRNGSEYRLVLPESEQILLAFDHQQLADYLGRVSKEDVQPGQLDISDLSFSTDNRLLGFSHSGIAYSRETPDEMFQKADKVPAQPHNGLPSPGGSCTLFVRDHNLVVEREDAIVALTTDGMDRAGYGEGADHDRAKIPRTRMNFEYGPLGCFWSPDSRRLLAVHTDYRNVKSCTIVESSPPNGQNRPINYNIAIALCGDKERPISTYHIFDIERQSKQKVDLPPGLEDLNILALETEEVTWSEDGRYVFTVAATVDYRTKALLRIDSATGCSKCVIKEEADEFLIFGPIQYNRPNVRILSSRDQVVWFSQKSGQSHLYLHDLHTGEELGCLSDGCGGVLDIIDFDTETGTVFFTGAHVDSERDPYERYLFSAQLDEIDESSWELHCLTPESSDHQFVGEPPKVMGALLGHKPQSYFSPTRKFFTDLQSTLEIEPTWYVRRSDGSRSFKILTADISELKSEGWNAPQRFRATVDGQDEDIYGALYRPSGFDPDMSYPIIERIYAGPQIVCQPRGFADGLSGAFTYGLHSISEMGFIVAIMDAPGTPGRSRDFHTKTYRDVDRFGIQYHRRALEDLGSRNAWIDLNRVGVLGHSFGGYASAAAMLLEPGFYKAGVSSAGFYNFSRTFVDVTERYFGSMKPVVDGDRTSSVEDNPIHAVSWDLSEQAHKLEGALMLIAGELDENVLNTDQMHFINALIHAGKDFEHLVVPGAPHSVFDLPYVHRRFMKFLCEQLTPGTVPLTYTPPPVLKGERTVI